jgi:hypothetical protein
MLVTGGRLQVSRQRLSKLGGVHKALVFQRGVARSDGCLDLPGDFCRHVELPDFSQNLFDDKVSLFGINQSAVARGLRVSSCHNERAQ